MSTIAIARIARSNGQAVHVNQMNAAAKKTEYLLNDVLRNAFITAAVSSCNPYAATMFQKIR